MPEYKFLATVTEQNRRGRTFEGGKTYDLPAASGRHWMDRHVAVAVKESPKPEKHATQAGLVADTPVGGDERRARPFIEEEQSTGDRPDAMTTAEAAVPKEGAPPTPDNVTTGDDYDSMLREDLVREAEARNLDMGSGYISKPKLVELLRTGRLPD